MCASEMEKIDLWLIPNMVNIYKTFRIPFHKSKRLEGTKIGKAVRDRMKDVLQWRREALKIFRILNS
jgi:hypothetical protein